MKTLVRPMMFALAGFAGVALNAQPGSVKDCTPVLAKDYYSYAEQNNLQEDFLKSIEAESWEQFKQSNDAKASALFSGGFFSLSDNYTSFDEKRSKYLETVHYNRTRQQAVNILQITTGPRAYPAYEACLRSLANGPALRVWAGRETMDEIELHVKYVNPANVTSMVLEGFVSGGIVAGAPAGRIWASGKRWGVSQELPFTIKRVRGFLETTVIVTSQDGSTPASLTFERADGLLTLSYEGTQNVLRQAGRRGVVHTPNNNENRGHCPNEVGHHDGKYCTSRTTVTLSTTSPHYLTNARPACEGGGCPWSGAGAATISADGLTASTYLDNWGSDVDAILLADEWDHLGSAQCGIDHPVPVVKNKPVLFTAVKECLPIATLKWTLLPDKSQGAFRFGDKAAPGGESAIDGTVLDNNTVVLASYSIKK